MEDQKRLSIKKLGAVGLAGIAIPRSWTKPIIDTVVLPAHAQTSAAGISDITPQPPPGGIPCTLPTQGWTRCLFILRNDSGVTITIDNVQASDSKSVVNWSLQSSITLPYAFSAGEVLDLSVEADMLYTCLDNGSLLVTLMLSTNVGDIEFTCSRSDMFL